MSWLKKTVKRQVITSEAGDPYLIRWAFNTPLGGIKLHHILRSDEDRDLHDHPWSFLSIILAGGYWEWTQPAGGVMLRRWYGPGSILWRPCPSIHRLELPAGKTAWTLVFTGPKRREWGFHTVCGFIPWFHYVAAKEEGC
jgi:hypothetical protein